MPVLAREGTEEGVAIIQGQVVAARQVAQKEERAGCKVEVMLGCQLWERGRSVGGTRVLAWGLVGW